MKNFALDNDVAMPRQKQSTWHHVSALLKLLFGSYGIITAALSLMALSVLNGNAFESFTSGLFVDMGELLKASGDFAYPISMLIAGVIFLGPMHYYAMQNALDVIIILLIVYLFSGFILGRMFKHPLWAFIAGIVVMVSFCIMLTSIIGIIDYVAGNVVSLPMSISGLIYAIIDGVFDMDIMTLAMMTSIENGSILGVFGALWGAVVMPSKNKDFSAGNIMCDDDAFCKV